MTNPPETILQRLNKLQILLSQHKLDAYYLSTEDEHLNEFVPQYRQRLKAVSGFTGSMGSAAIFANGERHLFVDSRYYLQAEQECAQHGFKIHKVGQKGEVNSQQFLAKRQATKKGLRVGADPFCLPVKNWQALSASFDNDASQLVPCYPNFIDKTLACDQNPPARAIYAVPADWTTKTAADKIGQVRQAMKKQGADRLLVTSLDEIAWLLNCRGSDVQCNPVFEAYLLIEPKTVQCFVKGEPTAEAKEQLRGLVDWRHYAEYETYLRSHRGHDATVWIDPKTTSMGTRLAVSQDSDLIEKTSPVVMMKAIKDEKEIQCMQQAHLRAGCAMVKTFCELQRSMENSERVTEKSFAKLLYSHYSAQPGFFDLSFPTIAGIGPNSAIVHYSDPSDEVELKQGQLLLVDSGIQLAGGTTDCTRTLIAGQPTEQQRAHYTMVLRGHIRLATHPFPEGTKGAQLDTFARGVFWEQGMDYGHGTGHGVGAFLGVHEGPQNISPRCSEVGFVPGMVVSNEPGIYIEGWGGIRLENLYVVKRADHLPPHPGGISWLKLESLTLAPFERRLIEVTSLSTQERTWVNEYHAQVREALSPLLQANERQWLADACQPLETGGSTNFTS